MNPINQLKLRRLMYCASPERAPSNECTVSKSNQFLLDDLIVVASPSVRSSHQFGGFRGAGAPATKKTLNIIIQIEPISLTLRRYQTKPKHCQNQNEYDIDDNVETTRRTFLLDQRSV